MIGRLRTLGTLWRNRTLAPEQLEALQLRKFQAVVEAARREVPFYRDLYAAAGIEPGMPRTINDVRGLPIVTKAQMRAAGPEALVSTRPASPRRVTMHTSGTTGEPLNIPLAPADAQIRSLVDFRGLLSLGFRPWDTLVTVGPGYQRATAWQERLGVFRTIVIPGALPLDEQVQRLRLARPTVLWCYASELGALLRHPDRPLRDVTPRFVIVSGASLDASVRRAAETELSCEVFVSYACMEAGRIAIQCPSNNDLHVNADHLFMEIRQGNQAAPWGEVGEVVLTTLNQSTMPFIRYHVGDRTAWTRAACTCGSTLPTIRAPEGRQETLLRFPGGEVQSPTRWFLILRELDVVGRYVVIQEALDWMRVEIVPTRPWNAGEQDALNQRLRVGLPSSVRLDLDTVERLHEQPGKLRQMISKLPVP
ncbi:MAG: phenylacetate--CoA ligase family protein [Gemmatimonadaceae bacterium]|nr:phenylacetate--CoA ligase family protein [Gemmatimonadaceae bacterium]